MQSTNDATPAPSGEWSIARLLLIVLALLAACYAYAGIAQTLIPVPNSMLNASGHVLGNDFLFFYASSKLVLSGAASAVFDQERFFELQSAIAGRKIKFPWAYPPHFLLFVAPLALLSYVPAMFLWIGATLAPFVLIARKLTGIPIVAMLILPPLVQNMISGQNGALTASLVACALAALAAGRSLLSGMLFGCLAYKPQVFVLAPICLLACRDLRALIGLAVAGLGLPLLGLLVFGLDIWRMFVAHLPEQMAYVTSGLMPRERFATIFIFLLDMTDNETIARVGQGLSTLASWALVYWCWRRTRDVFVRAFAFCVALPLSTPYLYEYDFALWSLPAAFFAMRLWRGEGRGFDWIPFLILAFLPPFIFFTSNYGVNYCVLGVLALTPFLVAEAFRASAHGTLPIFNPPSTGA